MQAVVRKRRALATRQGRPGPWSQRGKTRICRPSRRAPPFAGSTTDGEDWRLPPSFGFPRGNMPFGRQSRPAARGDGRRPRAEAAPSPHAQLLFGRFPLAIPLVLPPTVSPEVPSTDFADLEHAPCGRLRPMKANVNVEAAATHHSAPRVPSSKSVSRSDSERGAVRSQRSRRRRSPSSGVERWLLRRSHAGQDDRASARSALGQQQAMEHLREYLPDLQDEVRWAELRQGALPRLVEAARPAK